MKLQQLRYFEATCRLGSISRAAESLHVSQPSVSMAIRDLEREFGVSLIARRYQGFSLTEEGAILREMAESLLRHADHVSNRMQALGRQRRPVRLGVPPMIGTALLPALYRQLASRYPDLLLATEELGTKTLIRDLRENVLDVAFVSHHAPLPPEFDAVPVTDMEIVWCALPGHPLAGKERISIPQLEDEPLDAEIQVAPALQTAAQPPGQPADEIISREKEHQCIGDGQDRRPGRAGKETFEESVHKQDPRSECDEISAIL